MPRGKGEMPGAGPEETLVRRAGFPPKLTRSISEASHRRKPTR